MEYGKVVERAFDVLGDYARNMFGCGAPKPLLAVIGEPDVIARHSSRMNGGLPDGLKGYHLFMEDGELYELLDYMNSGGHHRDGAMSFNRDGVVIDTTLMLECPPYEGERHVFDRVRALKSELGTKHIAAARFSALDGIYAAIALSEGGGMIPFVGGGIAEGFVYVPERAVFAPREYAETGA